MVYVLLADGFEEVEALTPVDLLRRCDVPVKTVSIRNREVTGARGVTVVADCTEERVTDDLRDMEMLILPGGYPGYKRLEESHFVRDMIRRAEKQDAWIAAICAAPTILGRMLLLMDREATCYPGMEDGLLGAKLSKKAVCKSGKIITSRSAATAMEFSLVLAETLCGKERMEALKQELACEV